MTGSYSLMTCASLVSPHDVVKAAAPTPERMDTAERAGLESGHEKLARSGGWLDAPASRVAGFGPLLERVLPVAILGLAVVAVPMLVFQNEGLPRMRALQKELAEVNHDNAERKRDIGRLKAEVRDLRDDPTAVERIARDQLGLVRKSEIVFQFGRSR
jgi:cell division protein FtsB